MIKKLHLKLTLYFTLVIGIVITAMTLVGLYISESGNKQIYHANFLNEVNSIYRYLEQQTYISDEWIAQLESAGTYMVHIEDNGQQLHFSALVDSEKRSRLVEQAKEHSIANYEFDISEPITSTYLAEHTEFKLTHSGSQYYVSTGVLPKNDGYLSVVILYSLDEQNAQIRHLRRNFILTDLVAWLILGVFSYIYTKRILRPVEESRRKQVQFIAAASHELRSPLAVIVSHLSAIKKAPPEKSERFLNSAQAEAGRMSGLIDDMLALARADNHSWSIHPAITEPDTLLMNVYEKFEPIAKEKEISLSVHLPKSAIASCSIDKERIEQVLTILIDNAISYTPANGKVRLSLEAQGGKLKFKVQDNGSGISDHDKKMIFERFYRIEQSHTDKEHFGLGLSIAREIIRLHKGKLWVEDAPEGGAVFIFTIN